jgi:prefoldin subunit 5
MATKSSQPDSHTPGSEPGRTIQDIRRRAERLQQKVAELSETFDHIEHTLDEAAGETENSKD